MKRTRRQLSELSRGTAHEGRKTPRCAISPLLPDGCTGRGSGAAAPSCCPLRPSPECAVSSGSCQQQSPEHFSTSAAPRDGRSGCKPSTGAVQRPKGGIRDPRASNLAAVTIPPFFSLPWTPACMGTSRRDPARGDDAWGWSSFGHLLQVPRGDLGRGDVPLALAARCSHAAAAPAAVQGSRCCLSLLHRPRSLLSLPAAAAGTRSP